MKKLTRITIVFAAVMAFCLMPNIANAQSDSIYVIYGDQFGSDINVELNQIVNIPVHVLTGAEGYVADIHLVLGYNNQYIDSLATQDDSSEYQPEFEYPLSDWDAVYFTDNFGAPPNPEGWSAQAVMGWARISSDDAPYLHTIGMHNVTHFIAYISGDQINIGDDAIALGPGLNPIQGPSNAGDTIGVAPFVVVETFAKLHFNGGGYIEGNIVDSDDQPIENIGVVCDASGKQTYSDAEGFYHMGHYPGTDFNFTFSHPDYVQATSQVSIVEDETQTIDITLDRLGIISGLVVDYQGNPIDSVEVTIGDESHYTLADGMFEFRGLDEGNYDVIFVHDDYVDTTVTGVAAALNTVTPVNLTLHMIAGISGNVTYVENNQPIAGITVLVVDQGISDVTDADGNYTLDGVLPGTYSLFFDDPTDYYDDTTVVDVTVDYDTFTALDMAMRIWSSIDDASNLPTEFALNQNYPNPFNAKTTINYSIAEDAHVTLDIYDVLGRKVVTLVNEFQSAGRYKALWNANSMTSGMYFYKLQAGDKVEQKSMMLLK